MLHCNVMSFLVLVIVFLCSNFLILLCSCYRVSGEQTNKALHILRGFLQRLELGCFDFLVSKAVKLQILGTHSKAIHIFPFNVVY